MADHQARVEAIRNAFRTASEGLRTRYDGVDEDRATAAPPEGWNAAQIAHHVAVTTEFLAGGMGGANPDIVKAKPDGFEEKLASMELPARMKTFSMLEPPVDVTLAGALKRLQASESAFDEALEAVTEERCDGECVALPFGEFSLYEIGEFTAYHVVRHTGQLERTLPQA